MDVVHAEKFLAALDADWARLVGQVGPYQPRRLPPHPPYEALLRAITHQQLQTRVAELILGRFLACFPGEAFPSPAQILALSPERLRACGLSQAKITAIHGLAKATELGQVPSRDAAQAMRDEELIACLTPLRGIGRWTVEMFLMENLQRPDVLPADDFGVRQGYRRLKGLEKAPTSAQLRQIGQDWQGFRSAAAWYLWRVPKA
ncbi:DNA-3-methyladenine glycosylase family protein [Azonexus sp.]|uniref:DNA-3-methyladenine glycosylase family protein n=1 Tax=Azonexus sp. TaxID=1872668 RepID=UPI0039E2772F